MNVINIDIVLEHAYDWGYDEFIGIDVDHDPRVNGGLDDEEVNEIDPRMVADTARAANVIMPGLRQMAGYADAGAGTYTYTRDVVVVGQEVGIQYVTEGDDMSSAEVLDMVVSKFYEGADEGAAAALRLAQ